MSFDAGKVSLLVAATCICERVVCPCVCISHVHTSKDTLGHVYSALSVVFFLPGDVGSPKRFASTAGLEVAGSARLATCG